MGGRLGGLEDNDLPTRLRDMDVEGIGTSVLFPSSSFRVSQTMERDYAISYCRAYNNFIRCVLGSGLNLDLRAWSAPVPAKLPLGIDFFAMPFGEPMLFRIASAYERATHHRMSPPNFGPLEEKK